MNKKITMLSVSSMIYDTRIQREAKALRTAGYDITIMYIEDQEFLNSLPNPQEAWYEYNAQMEGIKTIRYFLFSRTWRALPRYLNRLFQAIELFIKFSLGVIRNKADIYHCHDLTPAVFTLLAKTIYKSKIVYDAHELEVEVSDKTSSLGKRIKKKYESIIVKKSSLVITVNDYIAGIMHDAYGKRILVIANKPAYLAKEDLDSTLLRTAADVSINDKIILYVGNLSLARGIDKMALALQYLDSNVYFVLMGTGRISHYKNILYSIVEESGIDKKRVKFVGPFSPDKVIPYLSGADVSVMLYQQNTSNSVMNAPNKLFQSVMARVPIVASQNKSFPKFLIENKCGQVGLTVDETVPEKIAKGINKILEDTNQMKFRENAECYSKQISWNKEANKLVNSYSKISSL